MDAAMRVCLYIHAHLHNSCLCARVCVCVCAYSEGLVELKHVNVIHGKSTAFQSFRTGIGGPEEMGHSGINTYLYKKCTCVYVEWIILSTHSQVNYVQNHNETKNVKK